MHQDEVYFRDTAHGFMAWALATVLSAAMLGGAATHILAGATAGSRARGRGRLGQFRGQARPTSMSTRLLRNDAPTPARGSGGRRQVNAGNGGNAR